MVSRPYQTGAPDPAAIPLSAKGAPVPTITIDFETRSEADLKTVGPWVYAAHPSTEILCMAYEVKGKSGVCTGITGLTRDLDWLARFYLFGAEGLVEAHNVQFERAIWFHIMTGRFNYRNIAAWRWRDSAAKAAANALPRALGKAGAALGLDVQKDEGGRRIMLKMSKPRKPTKHNPATWHEDPADRWRLFEYCLDDVLAEKALSEACDPLVAFEHKVWQIDQAINTRGVYVDLDAIQGAIDIIAEVEKKAVRKLEKITDGEVTSAGQVARLVKWAGDQGVELPNLQAATVDAALGADLPDDVRAALGVRRLLGKTSVKKYQAMKARASADGRVRSHLIYCGAERSGRWAGSGIQIQNYPRGSIKDPVELDNIFELIKARDLDSLEMIYDDKITDVLASCLRGCLRAPPGRDLIAADYSSIEARVLVWLCKDRRALKLFEAGADLYVDMAASIYSIRPEDVTPNKRQLGKVAILGLGYGMGSDTFINTAKGYGVPLSDELARRVVYDVYRPKYDKVVKLWRYLETGARTTIETGRESRVGRITFRKDGGRLLMDLPSGRSLVYQGARLRPRRNARRGAEATEISYMGLGINKQWTRLYSYGAKLTENAVQAIARDLLAAALVRVEAADYPIVLHLHDEIVAEVDKDFGSLKEFCKLMERRPKWAKGLPVVAEGWRGERFRK